jgi:hypothetical protein
MRLALRSAALIGALVGALPPVAFASTLTFFDNMDNAGMPGQYQTFTTGTGAADATVPMTGGNLGAYTNLSLILDVGEGVQIARVWNFASFDPSVSGAVNSAIVTYDVRRTFTSDPGATQVAKYVVLLQDGILHFVFYGVTTSADWEPFTSGNLVADAPAVNWTSGSEILFGFADSAFAGLGVPFTIDGGYDNLSVAIDFTSPNPVPEPAAITFLIPALAGLARMARKARLT